MGRRGRPRKAGPRTKSDRLSRAGQVTPHDYGNDRAARARVRYGEHYSSPIGRAYAAGLLGDGNEAKGRLDGAKKFCRLYRVIVGSSIYRCPLSDTPRGMNDHDVDIDSREHDWLHAAMRSMDHAGVRPWFDQITTDGNTDAGPAWLERLLAGGNDSRDKMVLEAALRALDIVAPPPQRGTILVGRWE